MVLLPAFAEALPRMIADIETLVCCESPSSDRAAVSECAELVARMGYRYLRAEPERIEVDGCPHLRWQLGPGPRRVLVLGHLDTVWPRGTLATHPFQVSDGRLRGPGCLDMKAGLVMAFHALAGLAGTAGVTVLITGDEELGSPSSRSLIEDAARGCTAALVLEAAGPDGALKVERKGVSLYQVSVTGRAAHAGLEPERGVNATVELAHQVQAVAALADPEAGTTVTPTRMSAGTTTNTVPATGSFAVDVRVRTEAEQTRVDTAVRALRPVLPGAGLSVTGGPNRAPLAAGASARLFRRSQELARALGLTPLSGVAVGGASDGNYTAGVGTATLDGLGASGAGAHADHEHVLVEELPARTALLAALIEDLLADPDTEPAGDRATDQAADADARIGTGAP